MPRPSNSFAIQALCQLTREYVFFVWEPCHKKVFLILSTLASTVLGIIYIYRGHTKVWMIEWNL